LSQRPIKDLAASVKQRLINYAQRNGLDFNALLSRFAMERLLYRLSKSSYNPDFYLKGAMLFALWERDPRRPTKDLDLLFIPQHDRNALERIPALSRNAFSQAESSYCFLDWLIPQWN